MENENYRELEDQEEILPEDQFQRNSGQWVTLKEKDIKSFHKTLKYNKGEDLPVRRLIKLK
jgi:hypothetical protein